MIDIPTLPAPLFSVGIFEVIFFIIFVVISILGQIFNKEKQPQERPRQRPANVPPDPDSDDPLEAEIAEFVRRAQGQAEVIEAEPMLAEPIRPSEPKRPFREAGVLAESSIEKHVDRHMGSQITSFQPKLVSQIENRDEAMDAHLQEVFDHSLGSLRPDSRMEPAADETPSSSVSADKIREMFASPDDVRKAIIMNEILTPPKWD